MTLRFWIKLFLLFSATNFFLHFAWEFMQIPFFKGMPEADHIEGVWTCTVATFGDTGIALERLFVRCLECPIPDLV